MVENQRMHWQVVALVGVLTAAVVVVTVGLAKGLLLAAALVGMVAAIGALVGLVAVPLLGVALAVRGIWRKAVVYRWLPMYVLRTEWRK
jgi:hypothetical protein